MVSQNCSPRRHTRSLGAQSDRGRTVFASALRVMERRSSCGSSVVLRKQGARARPRPEPMDLSLGQHGIEPDAADIGPGRPCRVPRSAGGGIGRARRSLRRRVCFILRCPFCRPSSSGASSTHSALRMLPCPRSGAIRIRWRAYTECRCGQSSSGCSPRIASGSVTSSMRCRLAGSPPSGSSGSVWSRSAT